MVDPLKKRKNLCLNSHPGGILFERELPHRISWHNSLADSANCMLASQSSLPPDKKKKKHRVSLISSFSFLLIAELWPGIFLNMTMWKATGGECFNTPLRVGCSFSNVKGFFTYLLVVCRRRIQLHSHEIFVLVNGETNWYPWSQLKTTLSLKMDIQNMQRSVSSEARHQRSCNGRIQSDTVAFHR